MSQFIRPQQAYGAQSAPLATLASVGMADQRNLHRRIADTVGLKRGTTQYGTMRVLNTSERHIEMPDAVYAALVSAGVSFVGDLYNNANAPGTMSATSEIPMLWNPGLHRQVVFMIGDSIMNSGVGAGTFTELNTLTNKLWAQPVAGLVGPRNHFQTNSLQYAADRAQTCQWTHPRSRIVFNFGRDSWRLANQSGWTYTHGSPWRANLAHLDRLSLHPLQQCAAVIFCGTNDVKYGDDNGNPGMAAVPLGTPGATYTGAINYVSSVLLPFIVAFRALYPTAKIMFVTPVARAFTGTLNSKFNEIATHVLANRAALGIDVIVDTRTIPEFDCRRPSVVQNATIYQPNEVHLCAAGNILLGTAIRSALDGLLG